MTRSNRWMVAVAAALSTAAVANAGFIDASALPTFGIEHTQAHSIETGELIFGTGGGIAGEPTPTPMVTYASGISPDGNGPFLTGVTSPVLRDDYTKDPGANAFLTTFRFAGGISESLATISILFLDTNEEVVSGFNITLGQGGNFVWTIDLEGAGISAPDAGFVQIQHAEDGYITWLSTDALHVGSNLWDESNDGSVEGTMYAFEITSVPAPGALALLGLAGITTRRARRRD